MSDAASAPQGLPYDKGMGRKKKWNRVNDLLCSVGNRPISTEREKAIYILRNHPAGKLANMTSMQALLVSSVALTSQAFAANASGFTSLAAVGVTTLFMLYLVFWRLESGDEEVRDLAHAIYEVRRQRLKDVEDLG